MKKALTLAVPCLRLYPLLEKLFASAEKGSRRPERYVVVDNGGRLNREIAKGRIHLPVNTTIYEPAKPLGVAGAFNRILGSQNDWIVISNDDVELHPRTLEKMVEAAGSDESVGFVAPKKDSMFCVFLLKRFAFERVGRFDERFYPAYFEDNDYHRRMKLAGIKEAFVEDTGYEHVGSATLKSFSPEETQEHHRNFVRLRELYVLKWGGLPGAEIYETPAI